MDGYLLIILLLCSLILSFSSIAFEQMVNLGKESPSLLKILDDYEAIDQIYKFCKDEISDNELEMLKACRQQLYQNVCGMNHTLPIKCTREVPLLFTHRLKTPDGRDLGMLMIYENQEPADIIYNFLNPVNAMEYYSALLNIVCQSLPCKRLEPILFQQHIKLPDGRDFGNIIILRGEEPADVVYKFTRMHLISEYSLSILGVLCNAVPCNRNYAVLYKNVIYIPNVSEPIGTLEIRENEEPCDIIFKFVRNHNLSSDIKQGLLQTVCEKVQCNRNKAIVFQQVLATPEGSSLGNLVINEGEEPVDIIYKFLKNANAMDYMESILYMACQKAICTRIEPIIFTQPIDTVEKGYLGVLNIYQGQEAADEVYTFCKTHDVPHLFLAFLSHVCKSITCTRIDPVVFKIMVHGEKGEKIGQLQVLKTDEPVDAIYNFGKSHQVSKELRFNLVAHVCGKLNCTRNVARVFRQDIHVLDEDGNKVNPGFLEIFEDEEPIDSIWSFLKKNNISESYVSSFLNNVCSVTPCTRNVRSIYHKNIHTEKGFIGAFRILEGQEPADAAYQFIQANNVPMHAMDSLLDGACDGETVICKRRKAVLFSINVNLPTNGFALFEIFGGEEPVDALAAFGRKFGLSIYQLQPVLISACQKTRCTRERELLWSMPVHLEGNQYAGVLEVFDGEEPIDQIHKFMVLSTMWRAGYVNHGPFMARACSAPRVVCNRWRPISANVSIPDMNDFSKSVAVESYFGDVEPADFLFEMGIKYNLTEYVRRTMLANLCNIKHIHCKRPHALLFHMDVLNSTNLDICKLEFMSWRWMTPGSWIPIKKVVEWYDSNYRLYLQYDEKVLDIIYNRFSQGEYLLIAILATILMHYLIISLSILNFRLSVYCCKRVCPRKKDNNIDSSTNDDTNNANNSEEPKTTLKSPSKKNKISLVLLLLSCTLISFPIGSLFYSLGIRNSVDIDLALYKDLYVLGELNIYEHEEPADVVYDFCLTDEMAKLKTVRYYSPIQDETLNYICSNLTNIHCNTMKATQKQGSLILRQNNIDYTFWYRKPVNFESCTPLPEYGANIDSCVIEKIDLWCTMLRPSVNNCRAVMYKQMDVEIANYERRRWNKEPQDHYKILGITRDALVEEIKFAYRKVMLEFDGAVPPYAYKSGNLTEANHHWELPYLQRVRIAFAYQNLMDAEGKEYWDQPCEWLFGGSACGRRAKDGGLSILMGRPDD